MKVVDCVNCVTQNLIVENVHLLLRYECILCFIYLITFINIRIYVNV